MVAEARARLVNAPISTKFSAELARVLVGMKVSEAEEYLNRVLRHEDWVPLRRHNKKVAHRKGVRAGVKSGRFMDSVVRHFLKLLRHAKANAEYKGMDVEKLRITRINVGKGFRRRFLTYKRRIARRKATHVEMVVSA